MSALPPGTWLSPAKLNLFLHITGRREDGYHLLQTVFQLLDHGDLLRFAPRDDGQLRLRCNRGELEHEQNLVLGAAQALQAACHCSLGADIELDKRLPAGAGLGGGSSNAATTLLALNHLWQTGLDRSTLASIGLRLGADVPVFVRGHSAWAEGVGEQLTPVNLPGRWYLVLTPAVEVSTATIFSHRELTRSGSAITMRTFLNGHSRNDCEALVRRLYPQVDAALNWLAHFAEARMTGTGASVFAAFDRQEEAESVLARLAEASTGLLSGIEAFVARGINKSDSGMCTNQQNCV